MGLKNSIRYTFSILACCFCLLSVASASLTMPASSLTAKPHLSENPLLSGKTASRAVKKIGLVYQEISLCKLLTHIDNTFYCEKIALNILSYQFDGFGNQIKTISPDAGETKYTYDAEGNLLSETDAKNQTTHYQYDALNRVIDIQYADKSHVTYTYDEGEHGIGRLSRIDEPSGRLTWQYNQRGQVLEKSQTIGKITLKMTYRYDEIGRLVEQVLPSGVRIEHEYNDVGQQTDMLVDGKPILQDLKYQPFGSINSWEWGNGETHNRDYNLDGWLISHNLGQDKRSIGHDAIGQIASIKDVNKTSSYQYDALGQLVEGIQGGDRWAYQYDLNGNRKVLEAAGLKTEYGYDEKSNRLLQEKGKTESNYSYDNNGNIITDGIHQYQYDARNRLIGVDGISYTLNNLGQRISKTTAAETRYFVYSRGGKLIGEYDQQGKAVQEHIYFKSVPIGVLDRGLLYYVHADHLRTPRLITDQSGEVKWRWESSPFGNGQPESGIVYNLRFPGQYYDNETGLHYNYFRDYDPSTGRYVQSDPIGLNGGLNTYAYVDGNPINLSDPKGLFTETMVYTCFAGPNPGCLLGVALNVCKWVALGTLLKSDVAQDDDSNLDEGDDSSADDEDKTPPTGKSDKHGDLGRSHDKTKDQLADLRAQAEKATGNEKKKIKAKIKNIIDTNNKKKKGTEHWN